MCASRHENILYPNTCIYISLQNTNSIHHMPLAVKWLLEGEHHWKDPGLERDMFFYRIALLTPCGGENWVSGHLPLLFGSLRFGLFLHLAPGCVLKVLSKACVSKLHEETKERREQGHILRRISSDFSVIHHRLLLLFCKEEEEKKTKHIGAKLV